MRAILFINGNPPEKLPDIAETDIIACTDGAFTYLLERGFPISRLEFVSGDFDSHSMERDSYPDLFIYTPDQEKTDFHKALELLLDRGVKSVEVYGGSGGEMDHFLGNLSVAYRFCKELDIVFYDEYSTYFFISEKIKLENTKGKMISLYPFPIAKGVKTKGLNWNINNEELSIHSKIGTRNFSISDEVNIEFSEGGLLVFVGNRDYIK